MDRTEKIRKLLAWITGDNFTLRMWKVSDSPFVETCNTAEVEGRPDNEVLCFSWTDDEGLEFAAKFTEEGLANARVDGHKLRLDDHEGDPCVIEVFSITPAPAREFKTEEDEQ
jgi:hypothetical protein